MGSLKDNASKYLSKIAGFVGVIPPIPSGEDKNLLRQLEKMKVGDPFDAVYGVEERKPHISGAKPEKIGVEVRVKRNKHAITYWYYWSHDKRLNDVDAELDRFFEAIRLLSDKTLALLIQLPPSLTIREGLDKLHLS